MIFSPSGKCFFDKMTCEGTLEGQNKDLQGAMQSGNLLGRGNSDAEPGQEHFHMLKEQETWLKKSERINKWAAVRSERSGGQT